MNISYIKEVIPFAVRNGRDCDISGVAYARQAKENEIAIARCDEEINVTDASVVLTEMTMIDTGKQLLFPFDSSSSLSDDFACMPSNSSWASICSSV